MNRQTVEPARCTDHPLCADKRSLKPKPTHPFPYWRLAGQIDVTIPVAAHGHGRVHAQGAVLVPVAAANVDGAGEDCPVKGMVDLQGVEFRSRTPASTWDHT